MEKSLTKPKMIIADIDGTLVDDNRIMSKRMKDCLIKAHNQGIIMGLASGRPLDMNVFDKFNGWNLPFEFDMMIGMNGGQLLDNKTKVIEDDSHLEPEYIKEIFEFMEPFDEDLTIFVYEDSKMYGTREDELMASSSRRNDMEYVVVDKALLASKSRGKLMFRGQPEVIEKAEKYARKFENEHYHGFITQPTMLEFQDPAADKGRTLVKYCQKYNIDLKDVWAFGDTSNDNGLLKAAGVGVCLKNGTDDTKACADLITEYTNNEDGMASFLEKNLFGIDEFLFELEGYKVTRLNKNTYRISENSAVSEYLFKGEKSGILLDTGIGAGGLKIVADKIMDGLPYIVINSHGHDDHVAGNYQFDEIYMFEEEEKLATEIFVNPSKKAVLYEEMKVYAGKSSQGQEDPGFFYNLEYKHAFENSTLSFKVKYLQDGQKFDLGGFELEAIKVKGHTNAGLCLLDKANRYLYVGDAVLRHVSILHVGGLTISEFIEGMEVLVKRMDEFDFVIAAHGHRQHGFRPLENDYVLKMIEVAKAIDVEKSIERHEADGDGYEFYLDNKTYQDYDSVSIAYRLECLK